MRLIIRAIVLLALVWIGLLLSGYGILIGSKENAAGLGLAMPISDRPRNQHRAIRPHKQRYHWPVGLSLVKKKHGHY